MTEIRNWEEHNLCMVYDGLKQPDGTRPADLDMFYLTKNKTLIIGEIKNEKGEYKQGQRYIHKMLIDNWKHDGVVLFIVHNQYVQKGARYVDVSKCQVKEYYYKGRWHIPRRYTSVKEAFEVFNK